MSYTRIDGICACTTCDKQEYEPCQSPCRNCEYVPHKICGLCPYPLRKAGMCNLDDNRHGKVVKA